ncbi:acyltransferase [Aquabacterium sp. A7-Y]|uniref:acyltransferase family protein n=1 Tax=Aquabacterium sp. A7-Y TaxID=1349605 RepID=UPI00223E45DE|nr:acyltransferase [Aquabacterium sp. A7-Y]MCW7537302.1 acyltransferase [Aquabacterium sp. A7-Y]
MEQRNQWVDIAKGIGILLVVYGHVARGIFNAGLPFEDEQLYQAIDSVLYSFHMPLFFFLSGLFFVASLDKRGPIGLIGNKLDTLLYPYLIWGLLQTVIQVVLSSYTNAKLSWSGLLSVLWEPPAHFWFLYTLFAVNLVCIPLYKAVPRAAYGGLAAGLLLLFIYRGAFGTAFPVWHVMTYIGFFALGAYFQTITGWMQKHLRLLAPLAIVTFLASQWTFHFEAGLLYTTVSRWLLLALALASVFGTIALCMVLARTGRFGFLAWLGTLSMEIYLLHVLTGSGTRIVLHKVFHVESVPLHLAVGMLTGVLVPIAVFRLLDRFGIDFLLQPRDGWRFSRLLGAAGRTSPKTAATSSRLPS